MVMLSLSGLDDRDIADMLAGTTRLAPALQGARVLVTGATGWFGTWLLDALVAMDREQSLGMSIVAISRDPDEFRRRHPSLHSAAPISWVRVDVREPLDGVPGTFTHVIHAAADSIVRPGSDPADLSDTIVRGTRHVLDVATRGAGTKMLLVSSGAVYGPQPPDVARWREDQAGLSMPLSRYADGKRNAESLVADRARAHGLHASIARCFAFVGPHMPLDAHFAIGNFIRDAALGRSIRVTGDGLPRRSYLYMSDLVVALLAILVDGQAVRAYNVGGASSWSIAELARRVAALVSPTMTVSIGNGGGGGDYVPDVSRLSDELGVRACIPIDEAIVRTAAWFAKTHRAAPSEAMPMATETRC